MSIWTFKVRMRGVAAGRPLRPALAFCAVAALAGCQDTLSLLSAGGATAGEAGRAVPVTRRAELGGGTVVVVPPAGYCLDKSSIANRAGGGFALIASCESLTGRPAGLLVEPAVITVSVSRPGGSGNQPEAELLAQALPDTAPLRAANGDGLTIVHVAGQDGALPGARGDTRHWRGAMSVNGRLVGLAVYGAAGSAIAGAEGERLLVAQAELIRDQSPTRAAAPPAPAASQAAAADASADPQVAERRQPRRGIFSRLFP